MTQSFGSRGLAQGSTGWAQGRRACLLAGLFWGSLRGSPAPPPPLHSPPPPPPARADLNDGIPGAIELLSKGTLHSDFWDWWYGAEFKWDRGEEGESGAADGAAAAGGAAAAVAGDADVSGAADALPSSDEFGEVAKQVHSAVEHAAPPGSPAAHSSPGAGNRQQFVAGVELDIPFRWVGLQLRGRQGLRVGSRAEGRQPGRRLRGQRREAGGTWRRRTASGVWAGGVVASSAASASCPYCCRLRSADGLRTPFTNYVQGYQGLLDYIW